MYYAYSDFLGDIKTLQHKIESKIGIPKAILCIARGGMTMSHMLALAWNIRNVYTLNAISYSHKRTQTPLTIENIPIIHNSISEVLILDEIIDSGNTLHTITQKLESLYPDKRFYTAVLFQKGTALIEADFFVREVSEWIDFFWEADMLPSKDHK